MPRLWSSNSQQRYDNFNIHKKFKEVTGIKRKWESSLLRNEHNNLRYSRKNRMLKLCITQLFSDQCTDKYFITCTEIYPEITLNETEHTINEP